MAAAARYRSPPQVHARRFDDELVIVDLSGGQYYALDEVGAAIWDRLMQGLSLGEITDQLTQIYDAESATVDEDVQRIARELVEAKLLEPAE